MASIQGKMMERIICRLYIRHRCNRGNMCPFYHPGSNIGYDSPTMTWLTFCKNYKMGRCFNQDCRYFHITNEEEDVYKRGRDIAPALLEQAMRKALLFDVALTGTRATCKGFLQEGCNVPTCPFRHISRHEFADEVLNTLRNEFEIVLGPGTDIPGSQQLPPLVEGGTGMNPPLMMTPIMPGGLISQEGPDDYIRKLENENLEIYRALDPEQKALNLEEIRERLLTLQAALQWKDEEMGSRAEFIEESLPALMPMPMPVLNYGNNNPLFVQPGIDLMHMMDNTPMVMQDNRPDAEVSCKLFVGGLTSNTDTEAFLSHFSRWGEVVDAVVMRDKNNKPRGFGFVTFLKSYMAEEAERSGPHRIDGKIVDVKYTNPRSGDNQRSGNSRSGDSQRSGNSRSGDNQRSGGSNRAKGKPYKLFVGGLSNAVNTAALEAYFQRYGKLLDAVSMQDPKTKRPRGFGYIEFENEESFEDVLADSPHIICGCSVTVERPIPRDKDESPAPSRGGGGNRGGGRQQSDPVTTGPVEPCKMFVGRLCPTTDERSIKEYFSQFAEVLNVTIMKDQGKAKGYGFVTFSQPHMVEDVLESAPHEIDGRRVDVGFATAKTGGGKKDTENDRPRERRMSERRTENQMPSENDCKLYVGNLPDSLSQEDIQEYFMVYGDILRVEVKQGNKNKKVFAFVVYAEPEMVDAALADAPHQIDGHQVDVGPAAKTGSSKNDTGRDREHRRPEPRMEKQTSVNDCKLYIGNLPDDLTKEDIREYFIVYGDIRRLEIKQAAKNKKVFGFVVYTDPDMVDAAIADAPHQIEGHHIEVGHAAKTSAAKNDAEKEKEHQKPEPRMEKIPSDNDCKLYIGNLPGELTKDDIKEYFMVYGDIRRVEIKQGARTKKVFAFVVYTDPDMVDAAIADAPHEIDGHHVEVGHAAKTSAAKNDSEKEREQQRPENRMEKMPLDNDCKLYVGNLPDFLTQEDLQEHFMVYGDIQRVELKQGPKNKKVFAFIVYTEPDMVDAALADSPHQINGVHVETNHATKNGRRDGNLQRPSIKDGDDDISDELPQTCKLYIGNLGLESTEESLYDYFSKYGEITDTKVTTDKEGVSKGFGFVTFADEMSGQEALDDGPHEIDGQEVNIAAATGRNSEKRDVFKRRYERESSDEPQSRSSKRKAEKRSHLD